MQELGPRFTLKLRSLQRGTFDSKHGEFIWIHRVSFGISIYLFIYFRWVAQRNGYESAQISFMMIMQKTLACCILKSRWHRTVK